MNKKIKRIIAWVGIILLASIYLVTLILALCGFSIYNQWFSACLISTLIIPIFTFVIIFLFDRYEGKRALGDPEAPTEDDTP